MARGIGLSNADRPSRSCLATRIEGPLSPERLSRVEAAEDLLPKRSWILDRGDQVEVGISNGEKISEDAIEKLKRLGYREIVMKG